VTVEFLNASVYVLGDVGSPGEYAIDKESLNIVQAISLAGDLTITGQRENVLVVREENGQNRAYRVNLTDKANLLQSPVYYLQQNDVVYVEPNDMQKRNASNNGNTLMTPSFWMSVVTFLTALGALIF
jgi:polysaccharide export outer membrane protein